MLSIGSHISSAKGYEAMGKQALKLGANTFAFFTRNPRGGKAKDISPEDVAKYLEIAKEHKFAKIVAHAPYTLNPCAAREDIRAFGWEMFAEDLKRMEYVPGQYYNFHPGSHVGQGAEVGIRLISQMLNTCLTPEQTTTVLLEIMSGKGTEIGRNFQELRQILDLVEQKDKVGICLDTCHVSDGGYPLAEDLEAVVQEFDEVIGLDYLKALHLNDSMNPRGSHKDRHEKIGQGYIGLDTFEKIVNHPVLKNLPMVLETPNDDQGWTAEIQLLRDAEV